MTQDVLGELFGISQPVANKWIHRLLPILNQALADLGELPLRDSPPAPVGGAEEPPTGASGFSSLFFMMAPSVRFNVPKHPKLNKRTTAVKRNSIPSRTY